MYRMIVVDDDVNAVNNMTKDFPWEEFGFAVENSFEDGESALKWLRTHSADLILCDIKMPVISGIELARRMQALHRSEKIIFISAYKDFEYARKALDYGVISYCVKPVTFRELEQTVLNVRDVLDRERRQETQGESQPLPAEHSISDVQIDKIRKFVTKNYSSVTLMSLSGYMQMNKSYLSRYFRDKTGKRLFDYITEVRMNAATDLLQKNPDMTVAQVAEAVGYTNGISFSRAYKKVYGIPPAEFRRNFDRIEEPK